MKTLIYAVGCLTVWLACTLLSFWLWVMFIKLVLVFA